MSEPQSPGAASLLETVQRRREAGGDELPKKPLGRAALLQSLKKKMQAAEVGRSNANRPRAEPPSAAEVALPAPSLEPKQQQPPQRRSDGESAESSSVPTDRSSGRETPASVTVSDPTSSEEQIAMEKGTKGKPIRLFTNYLRLNIDQSKQICQYRVEFDPPVDDKRLRFQIISQKMLHVVGRVRSFDGVMLCLPTRLPDPITTVVVQSPREPTFTHEVTVFYQTTRSLSSTDCAQHYNLLFQRVMRALKLDQLQTRNKFFDPTQATKVGAHRLEVWPGYVTAVNSFEGGVMLVCDVSHRVLQTATVLDVFVDVNRSCGGDRDAMKRAVIGEVVLTRYNKKTYRIDDVDFGQNPESTFDCRGEEMSYLEYYRRQYGIDIMDRRQPLLVSMKNMKRSRDAEQIALYLVPELSYLTGLTQRQRDDFKVMKDVSSQTQTTPQERGLKLKQLFQRIKGCEEAYSILKDWGITLPNDTVALEGRVLEPATLQFQKGTKLVASDIHKTVTAMGMYQSVTLEEWLFVFDRGSRQLAERFCLWLPRCAQRLGMQVMQPTMREANSDRSDAFVRAIEAGFQPGQHQMVVVMVPSKREDRYRAIKKACSVKLAVLSQVLVSKTFARRDAENIVGCVAMQMNAKLGGQPWAAKKTYKNAMIMGIDVSHDPKNINNSVAVVVASLNETFSAWFSGCKKQLPHMELLEGLQFLTIQALTQYESTNGHLPARIVVYRDGVGDGRLAYTETYELPQLLEAFKKFEDYSPKLTFVVVSKRIMTRLLSDDRGRWDQAPGGTVVDHTITARAKYPDFYLVSQKVRQGTVSPTHYVVVHNLGEIPADQLQVLTYRLTFMYFNTTDPIRVPAPCQYADRLAGLVGKHLGTAPDASLCDKLHFI